MQGKSINLQEHVRNAAIQLSSDAGHKFKTIHCLHNGSTLSTNHYSIKAFSASSGVKNSEQQKLLEH